VKNSCIRVFSPHPLLLVGLQASLIDVCDEVSIHSGRELTSAHVASASHVIVDELVVDSDLSRLPEFLDTSACTVMVDVATLRGRTDRIVSGHFNVVSKTNPSMLLVNSVATGSRGRRYVSPDVSYILLEKPIRRSSPCFLSKRENDVLACIAQGFPNKLIAAELGVSEKTVKFYVTTLIQKLHVRNRVGIARWAISQSRSVGSFAV